jgi:thiamine-monophosphate kinase
MELEFLKWLTQRIEPHPLVRVGVGDDAAVLRWAHERDCLVMVDMLADGVDFRLSEIDPRRAGRKALAVNLSDAAAMAARPLAAVVALSLPRAGAGQLAERLYEGLLPLAAAYNVAIAGGDTNTWGGPLCICVTLLAESTGSGPLLRSGGRAGDRLLVTGWLGGSILGKHLDFEPRVREAITLHERYTLHACLDISDGLALDLWRLCQASGCGAVIELAALPLAEAARRQAQQTKQPAHFHALSDGEDFELLLAVPPQTAEQILAEQPLAIPLTQIGWLTDQPGLWQIDLQGQMIELPPAGYLHQGAKSSA